jgi:hypothetical protein
MANDKLDTSWLASTKLAAENTSDEQGDDFWSHEAIEAARWNKAYPYQFILVKQQANGDYVRNDEDSGKWNFTLPFPPESLQIAMPFAIGGIVTQGGYVEEHGGAPIRMISLSGTLGVLPLRPTADTVKTQNLGAAIFAGTIEQANRVVSSARSVAGDFMGTNPNFTPNLIDEAGFNAQPAYGYGTDGSDVPRTSGYYQLRLLQNFFENYVAFKQTERGRDYRLAFCAWKQQSTYLVTPISFNASQSAGSPFEYLYQIQLKAWRRISLDHAGDPGANQFRPATRSPNKLASMLKAMQDARDVLQNARDILAAVGGDLDHALFEPVRQCAMFLKDALSVPLSFADLPVRILNSSQDAVAQYIATKHSFEGAGETFTNRAQSVADAWRGVGKALSDKSQVGGGTVGGLSVVDGDSAFDFFRHPEDNYDIFKDINVGQVRVPPHAIRAINTERLRIRALKRLDFEQMRDTVVQLQADFADAVGAGNTTFNSTFQRASRSSSKTPTLSDFQVMFALNRVVMEMNRLAASGETDLQQLRSIDFLAGLASRSGIAFTKPRSKFTVPMPYGVTMEQLAKRYLGDPDRWIEIAALNGLRAPFVDEEGFDLPLLVNGNGNQVSIEDGSNLYVGQQVWLSSSTTSRTTRRITKIERLSSSNTIVTLDGDSDLSRYSTLANATLHAFLPDTVNSMMMLYIPSDIEPVDDDFQTKSIPGLNEYDNLLNVGGVDLLLTSSNDLAITPDGDCRLAVGLTNIVQTAKIRLSVVQGTLNRHPSFGLPIKPGQSTADMDAKSLLKSVRNLFIDDPTFTGVTSASVKKAGPVVSIAINVGVRGQSQTIPISLDIKR